VIIGSDLYAATAVSCLNRTEVSKSICVTDLWFGLDSRITAWAFEVLTQSQEILPLLAQ
jgi:hypothetical protein